MTLSTLEPDRTRDRHSICPHCGHSVDSPTRPSIVEIGSNVLAALVLAFMLVPLGLLAWKSCADYPFRQNFAFDPLPSA
jgi:hypothetical protein